MNILITGCNGFVAKELSLYFNNKKHNIFLTNRKNLDVRNKKMVDNFFDNNKIDIVIHTAVVGGKRNHTDKIDDFFDNIVMFNNLYENSHKFKLMINIGSGAEFDRRYDINRAEESSIFERNPVDYYGLSKNYITRRCHQSSNIYNLRLFGCFGVLEDNQRLIKATYYNCKNKENLIIHQDKYMDFFYVKDFCKVVEFYINNINESLHRDVNLCYGDKKTIKNIVFSIKNLTNSKNDVILYNESFGNSYTGCYKLLKSYNLDLVGLDRGILNCINTWNYK